MANNNKGKSQFFNTREETSRWLDSYNIKKYTINDDLSVDVDGYVDISDKGLKIIPIKFGNVAGSFWCGGNILISLVGSPKTVGDSFYCNDNQLISLEGSPESIGGDLNCVENKLISLSETINCVFKDNIFFNISQKNFNPKELIQILEKYYNSNIACYLLTNHQFHDMVKPQIEKEILQDKLVNSRIKNKTKMSFI